MGSTGSNSSASAETTTVGAMEADFLKDPFHSLYTAVSFVTLLLFILGATFYLLSKYSRAIRIRQYAKQQYHLESAQLLDRFEGPLSTSTGISLPTPQSFRSPRIFTPRAATITGDVILNYRSRKGHRKSVSDNRLRRVQNLLPRSDGFADVENQGGIVTTNLRYQPRYYKKMVLEPIGRSDLAARRRAASFNNAS